MKTIAFALTFLFLAVTGYSQAPVGNTPSQELPRNTKEYYLNKREANMVRGWILTPAGVALTGLGLALGWAETANAITTFGQDEPDGTGSFLITAAGVVSIIIGTTSFISAGQNKRKARAVAVVGYEQVPLPQQGALLTKGLPTVGLKVSF